MKLAGGLLGAWRASPRWLRLLTFALALLVGQAMYRAVFNSDERVPETVHTAAVVATDDHMHSKIMCQQFVAKQLKAPSTAKFESLGTVAAVKSIEEKFSHLPDTWDSAGYVDSQNEFGAMLRSSYHCTVQKTGPDKWRLLELTWLKGNF